MPNLSSYITQSHSHLHLHHLLSLSVSRYVQSDISEHPYQHSLQPARLLPGEPTSKVQETRQHDVNCWSFHTCCWGSGRRKPCADETITKSHWQECIVCGFDVWRTKHEQACIHTIILFVLMPHQVSMSPFTLSWKSRQIWTGQRIIALWRDTGPGDRD